MLGLTESGEETPDSHVRLHRRAVAVDIDAKTVTFSDGTTDRYDTLVSTMPIDVLTAVVLKESAAGAAERARRGEPSLRDIAARASGLKHSSGYMVGIGLKSRTKGGGTPDTKSWMYFPEDNCPFYRVTYLSNYSPNMTPDKDNYYSLLCEVSESPAKPTPGNNGENHDAVIDDCIRGLENAGLLEPGERANIVSRWCYYADYSYPTPSVERDAILSDVIPWLERRGIYSRGRFGMWKYEVSNTDHTLMQGVELVNRLVLGEPETTIGMVYTVTEDGRNAAVHERSTKAGSGEKRIVETKPAALRQDEPGEGEHLEPVVPDHLHDNAEAGDLKKGPISREELGAG